MLSIRNYVSLFSMQFMSFLCILLIQSASPFCNYHGKIIRAITSIDVPYMIVNEGYKNINSDEGQTYDITSSTSGLLGAHHVLWILETCDSIHIKMMTFLYKITLKWRSFWVKSDILLNLNNDLLKKKKKSCHLKSVESRELSLKSIIQSIWGQFFYLVTYFCDVSSSLISRL